jgi:hypothetical protein
MGLPLRLITGGLNVCGKSLATFLVPPEGEPLVEVSVYYLLSWALLDIHAW